MLFSRVRLRTSHPRATNDTTAMISQTLFLVLGGGLLGAVQLAAGIAIGMWLRRSDRSEVHRGRQDMLRANAIANRLKALADEMSSSVGEHRSELDQASQLLTSTEARSDEALAELVVDVIGDIVRANQNLQSKLETAESRLQEQAVEIETHISRSLTDPLTGLPNRREFNDRLEERMSAWNRRQGSVHAADSRRRSLQEAERSVRPPGGRPGAGRAWAAHCARRFAARTRWPATAAKSSPCCCRARRSSRQCELPKMCATRWLEIVVEA